MSVKVMLLGDYFSAVDLADIARDLDQLECDNLQEAGVEESSFSAGGKKNVDLVKINCSIRIIIAIMNYW